MNRELKFRVYIPDYGRLVYFNLNEFVYSDRYLCSDKHSVQQYTGLKDKNNNPIYEGDIVQWGTLYYIIEWNNTSYKWQGRCPYNSAYTVHPTTEHFRDLMCGIIVGNIYELPCDPDHNGECMVCDEPCSECKFKNL